MRFVQTAQDAMVHGVAEVSAAVQQATTTLSTELQGGLDQGQIGRAHV